MNYFKNALDYCLSNRKFTLTILAISLIENILIILFAKGAHTQVISSLIAFLFTPVIFALAYSIKNNEKLCNIPLLYVKYLPFYIAPFILLYLTKLAKYILFVSISLYYIVALALLALLFISYLIVALYLPLAVTWERAHVILIRHPIASFATFIRYIWFYLIIAIAISAIGTISAMSAISQIATSFIIPIHTYLMLECAYELAGRFGE